MKLFELLAKYPDAVCIRRTEWNKGPKDYMELDLHSYAAYGHHPIFGEFVNPFDIYAQSPYLSALDVFLSDDWELVPTPEQQDMINGIDY